MKIITIANNKGGSGKTTFLFILANILREQNKKVLIIDLDKQANITHTEANREHKNDLIDYLPNFSKDSEYGRYRANYDYVLIDTPPSIHKETQEAFVLSDNILLITDISQYSINGVVKIIKHYETFCKNNNIKNNIKGIIINNYKNNKTTKIFFQQIENNDILSKLLIKPYIPSWTAFQNTIIYNKTLIELKQYKAQGIFENIIIDLFNKGVL